VLTTRGKLGATGPAVVEPAVTGIDARGGRILERAQVVYSWRRMRRARLFLHARYALSLGQVPEGLSPYAVLYFPSRPCLVKIKQL
jgi:hypothetical protein